MRNSVAVGLLLVVSTLAFGQEAPEALALSTAVDGGSAEAAQAAISKGGNPNGIIVSGEDYGEPLIHKAVFKGNIEVVKLLIESGADLSRRGQHEESLIEVALRGALQSGHFEVFDELVKRGLDRQENLDGRTLLMIVAEQGDKSAVARVLAIGQDPKRKDPSGKTALDYALESNENLDAIGLLLAKTIPAKDLLASPVVLAAFETPPGIQRSTLDVLKMCFSAGVSVSALGKAGVPVINRAVREPVDQDVLEFLIQKGIALNTVDGPRKQTALMTLSQRGGSSWVIELLLKAGSNPNLEDTTGRTALDYLDQNKYLKTSPVRKTLKDAMKK